MCWLPYWIWFVFSYVSHEGAKERKTNEKKREGYDTTVMIRSVALRGFDQQLAKKITDYMNFKGTKFVNGLPESIEKVGENEYKVTWKAHSGGTETMLVNTILAATGRHPVTNSLQLHNLPSLQIDPLTHKLIVNEREETSLPNIYCVGDCAFVSPLPFPFPFPFPFPLLSPLFLFLVPPSIYLYPLPPSLSPFPLFLRLVPISFF